MSNNGLYHLVARLLACAADDLGVIYEPASMVKDWTLPKGSYISTPPSEISSPILTTPPYSSGYDPQTCHLHLELPAPFPPHHPAPEDYSP